MRVMGVDPGLTRCGLGVVDSLPGRRVAMVAVDVARTATTAPLDARLLAMGEVFDRWLERYRPDALAVEQVFAQHNVRTITGTAQVAGIAILCAARAGVAVAVHTPTEVKAAVTGSGAAGKAQVQHMVARLLHLPERPSPADAADALALAICHLWRPAGTLGTGEARPGMTAAQRRWAQAERAARRPAPR